MNAGVYTAGDVLVLRGKTSREWGPLWNMTEKRKAYRAGFVDAFLVLGDNGYVTLLCLETNTLYAASRYTVRAFLKPLSARFCDRQR